MLKEILEESLEERPKFVDQTMEEKVFRRNLPEQIYERIHEEFSSKESFREQSLKDFFLNILWNNC